MRLLYAELAYVKQQILQRRLGGRDYGAGSYCGWVVVQLMHFCFQIGRDSDRAQLAVKERIQIFSKARREDFHLPALFVLT
jgi:hypothetical protein